MDEANPESGTKHKKKKFEQIFIGMVKRQM
jgi:hypothetical protein